MQMIPPPTMSIGLPNFNLVSPLLLVDDVLPLVIGILLGLVLAYYAAATSNFVFTNARVEKLSSSSLSSAATPDSTSTSVSDQCVMDESDSTTTTTMMNDDEANSTQVSFTKRLPFLVFFGMLIISSLQCREYSVQALVPAAYIVSLSIPRTSMPNFLRRTA